ncbi:hypothetical protein H5410_051806 [Solanum commersonii]|uniref:Uncharacterized protein n=1 Tax=Solanum commersonii TaxID=4109 RepID=A0A9J5WZG7_SOLCO|nr:hypothetical protein H5410_051806 [Solanum commersonii]
MATTKRTRTIQFLMNLRPEFEYLHANILNRKKLPALDVVVCEVLREETRLILSFHHYSTKNGCDVPVDMWDVTEKNVPKKYEDGSVCLRELYNDDFSLSCIKLFNIRGLGVGDEIGLDGQEVKIPKQGWGYIYCPIRR